MLAIFIFFVSTISLIYGVAAKLGDVLNPQYFQRLASAIRDYSFEHSLQNANTQLRILIDRIFGFRKIRFLYLPRLWNVTLVSLLISVLVIWPALAAELHAAVFDPFKWDLITAFTFKIPMSALSILVDYFAFAKSRTILSFTDTMSSAYSIIAAIAVDACITLVIATVLWYGPELMREQLLDFSAAHDLPQLVLIGLFASPKLAAYYSIVSGALIIVLFGVIASMNNVIFWISRLDKLRVLAIKFLNFEQKPHLAAAVLIIFVFTAVYWPIAFIVHLLVML